MYLNVHSWFSLRYGTLSPEKLAEAAYQLGIRSMALTDINNTSCAYQFIQACRQKGIRPILGIEFRRADDRLLYVGIARTKEGWARLCRLLSDASRQGKDLPSCAPLLEDVYFIYRHQPKDIRTFRDDEFYGIRPEEAGALYSSPLRAHRDRLVIFAPVTFGNVEEYKVHKLLRCIDRNILLGQLQDKDCATPAETFLSEDELRAAFALYPDIIRNTEALIDSCSIDITSARTNNRQCFTADREGDYKLLAKLAATGCIRRYGRYNEQAVRRVESELKVIRELDYCAYFLITWDIVRYGQSAGYFHVGRGSGANSIVAYCLGITDVDPLELDLYFERFINPHRSSPPDFDIDFSWDERDDVTDYIFKRYGADHVALLSTYNTFKGKSIIRELGKVVGLPKNDIDLIVDHPLDTDKHHPFGKHIFKYGKMLEGFPNYLSIHAGGVLISERPLYEYTALKQMPKGFPVTHFDMYGAEDLHFHKYDILSQRGLGHIKDAIDLVARNQGRIVDIHDIYHIKNDEGVRARLRSARCIGCFYIESPAMRGLISKLSCDNYVHLVAASSIIRPGVAKSGMMREYISRAHQPDKIQYLHPVFEQHLSETYGIMVYQEDVMKIVHHFAGLGLDESDVLRRIMTGKKKNSDTFTNLRDKYFTNCRERGYSEELTLEVWRQIESFSGYSFCKAHSASFAVESFQSLYLKTYYPLEFMVAVINNFGGFYSTELYIHEARMCGATIHPPCVNRSHRLTTIYGKDVYIGMGLVRDLEHKTIRNIMIARAEGGDFTSFENFVNRVSIDGRQLDILIRIGAFRFTGMNKYELMWEKNSVYNVRHKEAAGMPVLFEAEYEHFELPVLDEPDYEQAFDEIELLGFPLCSPFSLIEGELPAHIVSDAMPSYSGKKVVMVGYYVTRKPVRTVNHTLMYFFTWVDREGVFFDTVHFPTAAAKAPFRGKGCYVLHGRIVLDFGFPSLEVSRMDKLPMVKDSRYQ
ncbi:MAG: DNA polymerase III subunit alpha [Saprospiraceae bacterium]|nr:DNA polymerase III subunit alpha [Saprospiraceae bacterium]